MRRSLGARIFNGVLWSSAGRAFSVGGNFILTLALARALAPADYGRYFVALSTVVMASSVGTLGMDQIVVRFAAVASSQYDRGALRRVISRCLSVALAGTVLTCIGFWFVAPWFFADVLRVPILGNYVGLMAVWLFFATAQRQLSETFRGLSDFRMATLFGGVRSIGVLNTLVPSVAILALWASGSLTLRTALVAMSGASFLIVATASLVLWQQVSRGSPTERGEPAAEFGFGFALQEGWLLWLALLINTLSFSGTVWLAAGLDTAQHVAAFGVAFKFTVLLLAPASVVGPVLPPIIAELHAGGDMRRLERVVRAVAGLLLLSSLAILAVLAAVGQQLLHIFFGAGYGGAYSLLILLCVAQVVNIATGVWQTVLPMTGGRYHMFVSSVVAATIQFTVEIALGLRFGVLGVAVGFCTGIVIGNVLGLFLVRRKLGIWTSAWLDRRVFVRAVGAMATGLGRTRA